MTRRQIHPYLPLDLRKRLHIYAGRRGLSESAVIHSALLRYLDDANDGTRIVRRLDRVARGQGRVQREVTVLSEAFAVFVQLWFAHTPRLAESDKGAAERSALSRFSQFVDHVAGRVGMGSWFPSEEGDDDLDTGDVPVPIDRDPDPAGRP